METSKGVGQLKFTLNENEVPKIVPLSLKKKLSWTKFRRRIKPDMNVHLATKVRRRRGKLISGIWTVTQ